MADDKLKIVATVEDQFTGPLSKLQKGLKSVGDETAKQGAAWKKDWEGARTEVAKFQGVLGGFTPILSAVGVGSFGAVMSITGLTSAMKAFTGNTQGLSIMARETGVTIDKLRAFGELGERFGVSADAMKSSIGSFATTMFDLRRRWGEAYSGLQAMNLGKLAEDLVNAPNMEAALKRAMDGLQKIPEPEVRRRVSRMLFGTEDVGRVAASIGGDIGATLDEIAHKMGRTTQSQVEAAQRFERSMSDLRANMEGLKTGALTPLIDEFNRLVTYLNRPESVSFFKGELDRVGQGLKDTATEAQQLMQLWERFKGVFSDDAHAPPAFAKKAAPGEAPAAPSEAEARRAQLEGRRASVERQKQLLERNPDAADYQRKHDRMVEELKRVGDELQRLREQGGATVSPSSYGGLGAPGGSLIQKAAWGGGGLGVGGGFGGAGIYGGPGGGSVGGSGGVRDAPAGADLGDGIRGRPFGSNGPAAASGPIRTGEGASRSGRATIGNWWTSERQRHAIDTLVKGGVSDLGARALVARWSAVEARGGPGSVNPKSGAFGIAQWLGRDRLPGIKGNTNFDAQLAYALKELHTTERKSLAQLNRARNPMEAATGASMFERAEGYNGRTGVDNFTGQTANAMGLLDGANAASGANRGPLSDPAGPLSDGGTGTQGDGAPEPTDGRGVNADLIKVLKRAQQLSKVKFHIHEGLRTLERQREMVRRGWSKTMDSEHLKGRAVDVRADGDPAVGALDRKKYEEINRAMRQASDEAGVPVEWGGDWKRFKDVPHFQFPKAYKARPEAYAGDAPASKSRAEDAPGPRAPGGGAGKSGTLHIKFENAPPGMRTKHDMDGLFRETSISHGRSQMDMNRA
ncbi:M15 family metallopeptidase [Methylobacterium sp. D48H]